MRAVLSVVSTMAKVRSAATCRPRLELNLGPVSDDQLNRFDTLRLSARP